MTSSHQNLFDAIEVMKAALDVLEDCAVHLQSQIEGQLNAAYGVGDIEDLSNIRNTDIRYQTWITGLHFDIEQFRKIEAVIGRDHRRAPDWLNAWLDDWEPLTGQELDEFETMGKGRK